MRIIDWCVNNLQDIFYFSGLTLLIVGATILWPIAGIFTAGVGFLFTAIMMHIWGGGD